MSLNYIDRSRDEEIIDIVRSVMDNGTGKVETANEHILIKLMQLRGTPMCSFKFDQARVDFHYRQWKSSSSAAHICGGACEHSSDCALHNEPAYENKDCDCGAHNVAGERRLPTTSLKGATMNTKAENN